MVRIILAQVTNTMTVIRRCHGMCFLYMHCSRTGSLSMVQRRAVIW